MRGCPAVAEMQPGQCVWQAAEQQRIGRLERIGIDRRQIFLMWFPQVRVFRSLRFEGVMVVDCGFERDRYVDAAPLLFQGAR